MHEESQKEIRQNDQKNPKDTKLGQFCGKMSKFSPPPLHSEQSHWVLWPERTFEAVASSSQSCAFGTRRTGLLQCRSQSPVRSGTPGEDAAFWKGSERNAVIADQPGLESKMRGHLGSRSATIEA